MNTYEKLLKIKQKCRVDFFAMALAYFFDIGYSQAKALTNEEISNTQGNGFMTKDFCENLMRTAREIAETAENAIDVVMFCMAEDIFDIEMFADKAPRYKMEEMIKNRISCEKSSPSDPDAVEYFEEKYGCDIEQFSLLGYEIPEEE